MNTLMKTGNGRQKIVKILMRREDLTSDEANDMVDEIIDFINSAIEDGRDHNEVIDIFTDMSGLEPDYLEDILDEVQGS